MSPGNNDRAARPTFPLGPDLVRKGSLSSTQHSRSVPEEALPMNNSGNRTISSISSVVDASGSSLTSAVVIMIVTWFGLLLYDLIVLDYVKVTPSDYGLFRTLAPLIGLIPMAIRFLRPEDIDNDAEAYRTFVRFTLMLAATVIALAFGSLLLPSPENSLPEIRGFGWLIATRSMSLIGYLALPLLAESLLRLYRYRSKFSAPKLAIYFAYGLMIMTAAMGTLPIILDNLQWRDTTYITGGVLCCLSLILTSRSSWIINLKKGQKLRLVGLSMIGLIAASTLLALSLDNDSREAMYAFFPGIPALGFAVALSMIMTQSVTLFNALLSLPTADAIDRRNVEVSSMANFARLLTGTFDMMELADTAIAVARDVTESDEAWIELREGEGHEMLYGSVPRIPIAVANRLMQSTVGNGRSIGAAARERRRVEIVEGVSGARWMVANEGVIQLRSVAAAPLRSGSQEIGTLYVAKTRSDGFQRDDVMILGAIADQIALAIEQSRLIRRSFERERFEQEMLIARDLQQRLLPKLMPESLFHEIHAESEPASIVGGDYYDVIAFSDHTIGLIVADVSGKGASAALYMGMVKGIVQALSGTCATPQELLTKANLALYGNIDQRWFVTMTCAQIIDECRTLRIARAGHCPTLLARGGKVEYSTPRGIGLAIATPKLFDRTLQLEEVRFESGDYSVFFSDGLPEAHGDDGEEFGYDRLRDVVAKCAEQGLSPRTMRDVIFDEISTFTAGAPPADDSTLLILRWR